MKNFVLKYIGESEEFIRRNKSKQFISKEPDKRRSGRLCELDIQEFKWNRHDFTKIHDKSNSKAYLDGFRVEWWVLIGLRYQKEYQRVNGLIGLLI